MAGTLLHVTIARAAADQMRRSRGLELSPSHFRLGSVLVDLPYYHALARTAARTFARRPLSFHEFGTTLHTVSPGSLLVALLEAADDKASRSLALGAITHHSVDLVFHPFIDKEVRAVCHRRELMDSKHKELEDQIDLHCHYHLVGHSGVGRAYCARALSFAPHPGWHASPRRAFQKVHGRAPSPLLMTRWLMNLNLFAVASSLPTTPWISTLPKDDPTLCARAVDMADEAVRRCYEHMAAGLDFLDGSHDPSDFLARVPDLSLADGGPAKTISTTD